jgi:hypothetical protein
MERWKEKNKELEALATEEKRTAWRQVVDELGEDGGSEKAWKTIKMLSSEKNSDRRNESLVVDGRELRTDKEKANSFIRLYADINKLHHGKADRGLRAEVNDRLKGYDTGEEYSTVFTSPWASWKRRCDRPMGKRREATTAWNLAC